MRFKTSLAFLFSFLVIAGAIAAGVSHRWWHSSSQPAAPAGKKVLPSAASEYARLLDRFQVADSAADVSGTIRIYDGERGGVAKETSPFRSFRQGKGYFSQLSYLRTYFDGEMVLIVDTVHRWLEVSRPIAQSGQGSAMAGLPTDVLFSDTARFRLSGTVDEEHAERVLTLRSDFNPEIKLCRLYYDTVSYRLQRSEIEWWKDRVGRDTSAANIWLAKVEYNYRPRGEGDIASEMRSYIVREAGKIRAAVRYADYQVKVDF
jgi:hypothetical protein